MQHRMNVNDPEVRTKLIETGLIWNLWEEAMRLAVEDLIARRVPLNDRVPEGVVRYVMDEWAKGEASEDD